MTTTYHFRIREGYSSAIIEELKQNAAIEFLPQEEAFETPQWQKDEVRKRIEKYNNSREGLMDEEAFFKSLEQD